MDKIKKALKVLITGETSAVKNYEEFAKKAYDENFSQIGLLFNTLAIAERIHIKNHLNALEESFIPDDLEEFEISSTLNNVNKALENELFESKKLYPKLIKSIKSECSAQKGKVARLSMD